MKSIFLVFTLLAGTFLTGTTAMAQEYGLLVGVHQTTGKTSATNYSASGVLNFDLGLAMAFELLPSFRFRTGAIYNERHVDYRNGADGRTVSVNFAFIDVPADVQFNFTDTFGIFGGLIIAVNVNDNIKVPSGQPAPDPGAKALYALLNVGVALKFQDMIGFDFYYDYGMGDYARNLHDLSSFGGNFVYWF